MYLNIKYSSLSNKKNRWIPLNDNITIRELEGLVYTLKCIPDVDEVYINVNKAGTTMAKL